MNGLRFFIAVSLTGGAMLRGQCATCHPAIAASYAKTGMARSFYRAAAIEPVRYYHKPSETWYAIEERGGSYYQRRWRIGYAGKETEVQESRIDYVMGSGNQVRTYLHRTDRGAPIELPLAWYAENGGTWAMNPGHDRDYALSPRAVAYECMFCPTRIRRFPPDTEPSRRCASGDPGSLKAASGFWPGPPECGHDSGRAGGCSGGKGSPVAGGEGSGSEDSAEG